MYQLCIGRPSGGLQRPIMGFATREAAETVLGAIVSVWGDVADVDGLRASVVGRGTAKLPAAEPEHKPRRRARPVAGPVELVGDGSGEALPPAEPDAT